MTQNILTENGCKEETTLERLYRVRLQYFTELLNDMDTLRKRRIDLIISYKMTIFEIDKEIKREELRMKSKSKDTNI